ncbi:hypothetical protein MASR2M78_08220 [Treponema sp.]
MARNLEWFEDESFWDHFAPIMFDEARWAEVPAVVDGLELLASPNQDTQSDAREPLRVLDLCCGLGRISVELALRGYSCTGVDITASYLEAAKESARDEELTIDFIQQDIRRFIRPQSFDLAVNLYTSFGYFNNPSDDALVCRNAHASVVPGVPSSSKCWGRKSLLGILPKVKALNAKATQS